MGFSSRGRAQKTGLPAAFRFYFFLALACCYRIHFSCFLRQIILEHLRCVLNRKRRHKKVRDGPLAVVIDSDTSPEGNDIFLGLSQLFVTKSDLNLLLHTEKYKCFLAH